MEALSISSSTIAKMGKGKPVSMTVAEKICNYLDCNVGDIISFEKNRNENQKDS